MNRELPFTTAVGEYVRQQASIGKSPLRVIAIALGVASVLPAILTVVYAARGFAIDFTLGIVWTASWVVGAVFAFVIVRDAARERRDIAGGVFMRWSGPFSTRAVGRAAAAQVEVGGRKLATAPARALEYLGQTTGTVDYLPVSGLLLEVRDESGKVLYSALPTSDQMPVNPS